MTKKRVLVVGSNGLLGQKLAELLIRGTDYQIMLASQAAAPVRALASVEYTQLDITSKKDVKRVVFSFEPDVIINAAAMTNVDACEKERELAWKINVGGVEHLVEASRKNDARIVHVSSDYVFDGKAGPYHEDSRPEPISYYGKSKLASENVLRVSGIPYVIVRTIVLYGFAPGVKLNFVLWLVRNLEKNSPVRIVDDQFSNPTLADDLAYGIVKAIDLNKTGLYNIAGRDILSRLEFAKKVAKTFELDAGLIIPIRTSELEQPAARPLRSGLITLKAEVELGYIPSTADQGLAVTKNQLVRTMRQLADSAPVPGTAVRHSKRI